MNTSWLSKLSSTINTGATKLRAMSSQTSEQVVIPIEDQIEDLRVRVEQMNIETEGKLSTVNVVPLVSELLIFGDQSKIQEYFEMLLENGELEIPQSIQNKIINNWIDDNRPQVTL